MTRAAFPDGKCPRFARRLYHERNMQGHYGDGLHVHRFRAPNYAKSEHIEIVMRDVAMVGAVGAPSHGTCQHSRHALMRPAAGAPGYRVWPRQDQPSLLDRCAPGS